MEVKAPWRNPGNLLSLPVMENFRPPRSLGSDRFLAPFSRSDSDDVAGVDVELDEDEVFCTGSESPEPVIAHRPQPSTPNFNFLNTSSPLSFSRSSGGAFHRIHEKNFGVLAALPEEEKKALLLQRKTSISSASSATISPSSSPSSSRLIPAIPKPKQEFSLSVPGGRIYHQSAPVNVPVVPQRLKNSVGSPDEGERGEGDEEEMLPPHEIVAQAHEKGSPMTTFSVLEGAGRTLKGRDLRRVRNAIWRQTGFLD